CPASETRLVQFLWEARWVWRLDVCWRAAGSAWPPPYRRRRGQAQSEGLSSVADVSCARLRHLGHGEVAGSPYAHKDTLPRPLIPRPKVQVLFSYPVFFSIWASKFIFSAKARYFVPSDTL